MFSRNLYKSYSLVSHTDAGSLNDDQRVSSLAHDLGANAVVTGNGVNVRGAAFRLLVRMASSKDKNLVATIEVSFTQTPPSAVPQTPMQEIAVKLAQKAEKVGCDSSRCSLLVTDFYTSSASTSSAGLQLSDEFTTLLARELPKARLVNRTSLREFLNRNRIPVELLRNEDAERWLGRRLGATAVVVGEFNFEAGSPEVRFKVLDSQPQKEKVESFSARVSNTKFEPKDLQAIESYPKLERVIKNGQGEVIPWVSGNSMTMPRCTYMPNPPYTYEAREAKVSGALMADAIVTRQGTVEFERVVRGLPFGLNDQAIRCDGDVAL